MFQLVSFHFLLPLLPVLLCLATIAPCVVMSCYHCCLCCYVLLPLLPVLLCLATIAPCVVMSCYHCCLCCYVLLPLLPVLHPSHFSTLSSEGIKKVSASSLLCSTVFSETGHVCVVGSNYLLTLQYFTVFFLVSSTFISIDKHHLLRLIIERSYLQFMFCSVNKQIVHALSFLS